MGFDAPPGVSAGVGQASAATDLPKVSLSRLNQRRPSINGGRFPKEAAARKR